MNASSIIGWDVGGAHLKAARLDGRGAFARAIQLPCPLWQGMHHLDQAIDQALSHLGPAERHAVTMTGEMVDLFASRDQGVRRLVGAIAERIPGRDIGFYAGEAGFVGADQVVECAPRIASANWHATATFVAARVPQGLLVDIGSTTTDVIVVAGGRVAAVASSDAGRLACEELVYTGVSRTPLMALATHAPFRDEWIPLIAELFATTADIHRITEDLCEDADQHPAADGGEKTKEGSARRLARMIGHDAEAATLEEWTRLAGWFAGVQLERIAHAAERSLSRGLLGDEAPIVIAGSGRFLAARLAQRLGRSSVDFADLIHGGDASRGSIATCAPAVSVAGLLRVAAAGRTVDVGG